MPFQKDVVSQLDYNSRLRLTICFFHMKAMLKAEREEELEEMVGGVEGGGAELAMMAGSEEMALSKTKKKAEIVSNRNDTRLDVRGTPVWFVCLCLF